MSQHADITRVIVCKAIKENWSAYSLCEHYSAVLESLEWDKEFCHPKHILQFIQYVYEMNYFTTYGFHEVNFRKWVQENLNALETECDKFDKIS